MEGFGISSVEPLGPATTGLDTLKLTFFINFNDYKECNNNNNNMNNHYDMIVVLNPSSK